jgi:hypothetical protein
LLSKYKSGTAKIWQWKSKQASRNKANIFLVILHNICHISVIILPIYKNIYDIKNCKSSKRPALHMIQVLLDILFFKKAAGLNDSWNFSGVIRVPVWISAGSMTPLKSF